MIISRTHLSNKEKAVLGGPPGILLGLSLAAMTLAVCIVGMVDLF